MGRHTQTACGAGCAPGGRPDSKQQRREIGCPDRPKNHNNGAAACLSTPTGTNAGKRHAGPAAAVAESTSREVWQRRSRVGKDQIRSGWRQMARRAEKGPNPGERFKASTGIQGANYTITSNRQNSRMLTKLGGGGGSGGGNQKMGLEQKG